MKKPSHPSSSVPLVRGLCLSALLACGSAAAPDATAGQKMKPAPHPDSRGWPALFRGDLADAEYPEGIWMVRDGLLTATEDKNIWTKADYENFILDLEFKSGEAANSGVVVYCADIADWIPASVEVQILDDYAPKWAQSPKNWLCGGIFGHLAPRKQVVRRAGEWNRMTITCRGPLIAVALNGELVTEMDMRDFTSGVKNPDGSDIPAWLPRPLAGLRTKGRIGLQGKHGGAPIFFRNLKIKLL